MRRLVSCCIALLLAACICPSLAETHNTLTSVEEELGWKLLFDGKTLDGWASTGDMDVWSVVDGTLTNDKPREDASGPRGYLYTKKRYGNFTLSFEFKLTHATNSGLFFRWDNLNDPIQTGMELQLYDSYKDVGSSMEGVNYRHCGSIYEIMAPKYNVYKPAGEWNTVRLNCRDNLIWVDMNGKRIIYLNLERWTTPGKNPDGSENKFHRAYKDMPREGHIGIQDYRGVITFRDIKIRPL